MTSLYSLSEEVCCAAAAGWAVPTGLGLSYSMTQLGRAYGAALSPRGGRYEFLCYACGCRTLRLRSRQAGKDARPYVCVRRTRVSGPMWVCLGRQAASLLHGGEALGNDGVDGWVEDQADVGA